MSRHDEDFFTARAGWASSRRRFCKPVCISSSTTCECLIKEKTNLSAAPRSSGAQKEPPRKEHEESFRANFCILGLKLKKLKAMSGKGEELSYREAIEMAHESITRFPLIPIHGVPLMSLIANDWDNVWAFRPDPSDILIATYPKAGTDIRNSSSGTQMSGLN